MLGFSNWMRRVFLSPLLLAVGCTQAQPTIENSQEDSYESDLRIGKLTAADNRQLSEQRAFVEAYLGDLEDNRHSFQSTVEKLGLIRAVLERGNFRPDQTYELQSLGTVLGDTFVQELGMEWIMVEDEHGRDPAVRLPGTSIILFPVTMISKRVEDGEVVDVHELFRRVTADVKQLKAQGV